MLLNPQASLLSCPPFQEESTCAVVLFGGSYGGMLAGWHRFKYPHLTSGALACGAPVDLYPGEGKQELFYEATLHDFRKYGARAGFPLCADTVEAALAAVETLDDDLPLLTRTFHTCRPLAAGPDGAGVEKLLFFIKGALATMACVDYPFAADFITPMPASPVNVACARVAAAAGPAGPNASAATLARALQAGVSVFTNYTGIVPCHNVSEELVGHLPRPPSHGVRGRRPNNANAVGVGDIAYDDIVRPWNYQACTELILEPLTTDGSGFYTESDAQVAEVAANCRKQFGGVSVRPEWMVRSFGTGAQLARATTNIVFSDGEKDPWRVGSVPANASALSRDGSVVHILLADSAHHEDLRFSRPEDPPSVAAAKALEREHIARWIAGWGKPPLP